MPSPPKADDDLWLEGCIVKSSSSRSVALAVACVLALAGCAGPSASPSSPSPTSPSTQSSSPSLESTSAPPSSSSPASPSAPQTVDPANNLTGYGATQGEWDRTHTPDTKFAAGSTYNPGYSSAGCSGDGAEYYAMTGTTFYSMCLNNNLSQAAAQAIVMREFPSDTSVLWQAKQTSGEPDECYQVEVRSPTLATVLGTGGGVLVEFQTFERNNSSGAIKYNPANVNNVLISGQDITSPSGAPGC